MSERTQDHLFLDGRFLNEENYTSNSKGGPSVIARSDINREHQGEFVKVRFQQAIEDFRQDKQEQDFVYVVLRSVVDFELDIDKFDDKSAFRLAYTKIIEQKHEDDSVHFYQEAGVHLNKTSIAAFLRKIEEYISKNTWQSELAGEPVPRNNPLIANIDDIRAATLQSFWQEPELPFPTGNEQVWWEVWLNFLGNKEHVDYSLDKLRKHGIQVSDQRVYFPEHAVVLVKGSASQLQGSLLYLDLLCELRKPRDLADFFTYAERTEQNAWIDDLVERVVDTTHEHEVAVCLLDTGVTSGNPLLAPFVSDQNLTTIFADDRITDKTDISSGHGTPMAGLILFGDLTDVFGYDYPVEIKHQLESVRIIDQDNSHDPQNYGSITIEAVSRAEVTNPTNKRIVCLAVSGEDNKHSGRPSLWSATIDMYSFGMDRRNDNTLFILSAGNLPDEERANYPMSNADHSINDPGQAFNALTVGAYTLKDRIDADLHPVSETLSQRGTLSPSSTTSMLWHSEWARKPDIVMEGGNQALQYGGVITPDSLQLLSTSKGSTLKWLTSFGDTSAATALASRFAAMLYVQYPHLWPETIRGLIVHSADWTPGMLGHKSIEQLSAKEKNELIRTVGYGVPNLNKATKSASNALTLISEAELKPYKLEDSRVKTDKFHLYELPWPEEELIELFDTPVTLTVTLSYFIEPNPGNKRYAKANNYMSHGLRIKMINADEPISLFAGRVSADMKAEDHTNEGNEKEWLLGENLRNKGTVHKDIWKGSAADLATRNVIAIYPITGWWRTRKKLSRYENSVRYSLIVSIETPNIENDIYTPVRQQIEVPVVVPIEIKT